ncbi:MAG: GWxTD domain-containing protein [Acidobacteria bacterium]|nr:GWxTD domain-containing protein [Acidobacteriota bacterium]MCK6682941.1 GWxTD domain-containing protein [Thermoanaerobaculia bacterium]
MLSARAACALALLVLAFPVVGKPVKYKSWNKSPEFVYLATSAEKKEWKALQTDEEAEKYIEVFWARRCPDPAKAWDNPFRATFEARVARADQLLDYRQMDLVFSAANRGALTYVGQFYILVGPPTAIGRRIGTQPEREEMDSTGRRIRIPPPPDDAVGRVYYSFRYEPQDIPEWVGLKNLEVRWDQFGSAYATNLTSKAAAAALLHPDLKELPPQVPNPAAPPVPTPATPAAQ